MSITSFAAVNLLCTQIRRTLGCKVLLLPSPLRESGLAVKVALVKIKDDYAIPLDRRPIAVKATITIEGKITSETALSDASSLCEAFVRWIRNPRLRLEDEHGKSLADHRLVFQMNEESGMALEPDNDQVAWLREEYSCTISIP